MGHLKVVVDDGFDARDEELGLDLFLNCVDGNGHSGIRHVAGEALVGFLGVAWCVEQPRLCVEYRPVSSAVLAYKAFHSASASTTDSASELRYEEKEAAVSRSADMQSCSFCHFVTRRVETPHVWFGETLDNVPGRRVGFDA